MPKASNFNGGTRPPQELRHTLVLRLALSVLVTMTLPLGAQMKSGAVPANTTFNSTVLLLKPQGPHVSEIHVPNGPFILSILDRSGLKQPHVSLTLGTPLATLAANDLSRALLSTLHKDGNRDQTVVLNLQPGTYYLTVQENLGWTVRVVVEP
jgi:hypothetical protein